LKRFFYFLCALVVAACSDDAGMPVASRLDEASLPGVYAGVFPCDGCPGIETTLWLRSDSRFFFRQHYPADESREASNAYSLGRWSALVDEDAIELVGEGPRRVFTRTDADTLDMRTGSTLEHRLTRKPTTTDFTETVRLTGVMQMQGNGPSFSECLTGYLVPVSQRGDFSRFRHQYRSAVGRGKPAFVEFDGRFSWSDEHALQSLTIERFVTIKVNGSC
jgi:hypothetical protein